MKTRKSKKNPDEGGLGFAAGLGIGAGAMGAIWLAGKAFSNATPMPASTQLPAPMAPVPLLSGRTPEAERQAPLVESERWVID